MQLISIDAALESNSYELGNFEPYAYARFKDSKELLAARASLSYRMARDITTKNSSKVTIKAHWALTINTANKRYYIKVKWDQDVPLTKGKIYIIDLTNAFVLMYKGINGGKPFNNVAFKGDIVVKSTKTKGGRTEDLLEGL